MLNSYKSFEIIISTELEKGHLACGLHETVLFSSFFVVKVQSNIVIHFDIIFFWLSIIYKIIMSRLEGETETNSNFTHNQGRLQLKIIIQSPCSTLKMTLPNLHIDTRQSISYLAFKMRNTSDTLNKLLQNECQWNHF